MDEQDLERCIEVGQQCLALMAEHGTAPVPRNYELFYKALSGEHRELATAFQESLAKPNALTPEVTQRLYENFIVPERLDSKVATLGSSLQDRVSGILELVHSATHSTEAFGETLKIAGDQLGSLTDPKQFQTVLQSLVMATKKMADNSQELKGRLAESKKQISELQTDLERIREESCTDALTGVANRKRFDQVLGELMNDSARQQSPLCLMLLDIDHFKKFNDTFGHQTGDAVLKLVARAMQSNVKGRDLVARYGGEEFAIILPRTALRAAMTVAEQVRRNVMGKELVRKSTGESLGRVTLSIGVACHKPGEPPKSLVHRADAALYVAKNDGRNCVKSEQDVPGGKGRDAA